MLSPELGRAGFFIGMFVVLTSGALLLAVRPGSAEFVVTSITFVIGVLFSLALVALIRIGVRRKE